MGCGVSTPASDDLIKPAQTVGLQENLTEKNTSAGTNPNIHHVTEEELEARGFGSSSDYLGMHKTFYAMPSETDEEKRIAVAALASDGCGPVAYSKMDTLFTQAKQFFKDLDKDRSGALELAELEPLCVWLFDHFARSFGSAEEKNAAIEQQLNRFRKNGPPTGSWTFRQFEEYYRSTIAEVENYQLARNEAYAKGYDKSAAAAKFAELDTDGSLFLTGTEVERLAEWTLTALSTSTEQISAESLAIEAANLVKNLDSSLGNNDGKISFAEFDGYFGEKVAEIEQFRKNELIRHKHKEEKSAQKIQACARGKQGRDRVAKKRAEMGMTPPAAAASSHVEGGTGAV